MANKFKGEVKVTAGEQEYTLRFDMNALVELEDATGMPVPKLALSFGDPEQMSYKLLRSMFWAGLLHHHPDVTVEEAGRIMSEIDLLEVIEKISEAFAAAFNVDEKKAKALEKKLGKTAKAPGTGK